MIPIAKTAIYTIDIHRFQWPAHNTCSMFMTDHVTFYSQKWRIQDGGRNRAPVYCLLRTKEHNFPPQNPYCPPTRLVIPLLHILPYILIK